MDHSRHLSLIKGDRHMFSSSDDGTIMKQILTTHAPDGRNVDVKPLLHVIEDILQRSSNGLIGGTSLNGQTEPHVDSLDDRIRQPGFMGILEALADTIHRISCEISCKCSAGVDAHSTTMSLFTMLSSYSWDAKVVLALAAFAVNYGEFWLLAQLYPTNQLAKSISLLKQLPDLFEHNQAWKPRLDALNNLISAVVDVTKCIVELKELPPQYITSDESILSKATAHVPTAAYWTIRSVVTAVSQIISLIGYGFEFTVSTMEAWELSSLAHKVRNIHEHLTQQLALCYKYIDERKHVETYQMLVRLFETSQIDNMKILRALFYTKDDYPLVDGITRKRVGIEVLRRRSVLLLISDLDISQEELSVLEQMYRDARQHPSRLENQFEVVWIPVIDKSVPWTELMQKKYEDLQANMQWYTLYQPSAIDPAVIKYIKEVWHFVKKPILVVLDPQGKVASPNALHMMWIWGIAAFPFTSAREEVLWREESWRLELLVDGMDSDLLKWISEGRFICLYGGEDIKWIRDFTTAARAVARTANIPLEMVYVGKSKPGEKVRKNINVIIAENLSHSWTDLTSIWFFWVRLESMMYSKMQLGKTVENDQILQELIRMLGYDNNNQGWAVISKGATGEPHHLAKGNGEVMLSAFNKYDTWKVSVETKGFVPALNDHLENNKAPHHCTHLKLPGSVGKIAETVVCAECGRPMEKFILYECCND
ncbi:hypothetical protein Scep_021137 [Stephania cephalantha]|uniref:Protein SIEVE ELEMENT OCCLUSION B-like n=1 Tax=Stephania cephalantha TaxID=152367 RepID=A0AAP0HWL5_9MAGN